MAILVIAGSALRAQPPELTPDAKSRFVVPLKAEAAKFRLWVLARSGSLQGATVRLRTFKDPDGNSLALTETPRLEIAPGNGGAHIEFTIPARTVLQPGDYSLEFLIEGRTDEKTWSLAVGTTLARPAADLNTAQLNGVTFRVVRDGPWAAAGREISLPLTEIKRRSDIVDLQVAHTFLYDAGKAGEKPEVRGKIGVRGTPLQILSGETKEIVISVSEIERTGTFATDLTLSGPSFAEPKTITAKFLVTDGMLFPSLIILAGVIGGALVSAYTRTAKPRIAVLRLKTRLNHALNCLRPTLLDPVKRGQFNHFEVEFEQAETQIANDDYAGATAKLQALEVELQKLRSSELVAREQLRTELEAHAVRWAEFARHIPDDATVEKSALQTAQRELSAARMLIDSQQGDQARRDVTQTRRTLALALREKFGDWISQLERDLAHFKLPEDSSVQKTATEKIAAARALGAGSDVEAAMDAFVAAKVSVAQAKPRRSTETMKKVSTDETQPAPPPDTVTVIGEATTHVTDAVIEFRLTGQLAKEDALVWDFGDTSPRLQTSGPTGSHLFRHAGSYTVAVGSKSGGAKASVSIRIAPGPAEKAERALQRRGYWLESGVVVLATLLAWLTGLSVLYTDKPFGSLSDYTTALLWGFGMEQTLRGFGQVVKKLNP